MEKEKEEREEEEGKKAALNGSNASVETSPTRGNAIDNRVRCHRAARYIRITMELTLGEATRGVALRTRASPLTAIFVPPFSLLVQDRIPPRDGRVSLPLSLSLFVSVTRAPPPPLAGLCNHSCVNRIPPSLSLFSAEMGGSRITRRVSSQANKYPRSIILAPPVIRKRRVALREAKLYPAYVSLMRPPFSLPFSLCSRGGVLRVRSSGLMRPLERG